MQLTFFYSMKFNFYQNVHELKKTSFLIKDIFSVLLSLIWLCCFWGTKSFWGAPICGHVFPYDMPSSCCDLWYLSGCSIGLNTYYFLFEAALNVGIIPLVFFCALGIAKGYTTQGGYYLFLHFNNKQILMARGVA